MKSGKSGQDIRYGLTMYMNKGLKIISVVPPDKCRETPFRYGTYLGFSAPALGPAEKTAVPDFPWVEGIISSPAGEVPVIKTFLSPRDRLGMIRCRIGGLRTRYSVPPGLYAAGKPDESSRVMVSANYKLSFDNLRRALDGIDAWILVLDTRGVNVWCAAGKGAFGTEELVTRIFSCGLARAVAHRDLIVPQLGAPGINAYEVEKRTGFRVRFGPVRARDIPGYIARGCEKTKAMSTVSFSFIERLVLVPMEIIPALKLFLPAALAVAALLGLQRQGIIFSSVRETAIPIITAGLAGVLSGGVITPLMLPVVPFRSFALKGLTVGLMVSALLHGAMDYTDDRVWAFYGFLWLFVPMVSSYLALRFTGSTVYTGMSGVKKEIRYALPLYIAGSIVSFTLLVVYKLTMEGIL
ncbi:MAG TPA: acetyl-CoA synthase subunit gamma [Spirochaetes bacterium]|nr:acetyl-CoA synthase subunit gamma [Spirochaetota bacterium]